MSLLTKSWYLTLVVLVFTSQIQAQFNRSKPVTRAVIVGISDYENENIPDLQFAHRDAQAFYSYLRSAAGGSVSEDNIQLLTNTDATGGNVHKALYWMVRETQKNDRCIIYFAGHGDVETSYGGEQGHLLVHDSPSEIYQINSIRMDDLQRIVQTLSVVKEAKVYIYSDACRSGNLAGSAVNGAQATAASMSRQFANEVKLMSCQPDEYSVEGQQWGEGRGLFSYVLLDGLRGLADVDGDLQVTLKELESYLYDGVQNLAPEVQQTPIALGNKSTSMALVDPATLDSLSEDKGVIPEATIVSQKEVENDLVSQFYAAVESGVLLDSEAEDSRSAQSIYQTIAADPNLKDQELLIRGDFIAALQDEAQQSINRYLSTDPDLLEERWKGYAASYYVYGDYLKLAARLMGQFHYLYPQIKAKAIYFNVVAQRLEWDKEHAPKETYAPLLDSLTQAIIMDPNSAFINNEMGLVYERMGELEDALKQYELAIKLSPTWALPVYNSALVYQNLGEADASLQGIQKAIKLKPDFRSAITFHAEVLFELDQAQSGIKILDTYRNNYGEDYSYLVTFGHIKSEYEENLEDSKELFKKAISIEPNISKAYINLGNIHLRLGEFEEACISFKKWIEIEPNNATAWSDLGTAYYKMGNMQKSIECYSQVVQIDAHHSFRVYLASAYMKLGQWNEAIRHLEYFVQNVDPQDGWSYYDLACCHAQLNNYDLSVKNLKWAFEHGFEQVKLVYDSNYLEPLRQSEHWSKAKEFIPNF